METLTYSMIAMAEESPRNSEICTMLEHDPHYAVQRVDLNTQHAETAIARKQPDLILIMVRAPQLLLKNWIGHVTEKNGIPVVLLSAEQFTPADPLTTNKMVQCLFSDTNVQTKTVVLTLGIKIRLAVNLDATRRCANRKLVESQPVSTLQKPIGAHKFGSKKLIAIGASMGGVEAVNRVLELLPAEMPGIVVVQHMPKGFTEMYAKRLDSCCKLRVVQAEDHQKIEEGTVYIAPGDFHMTIHKSPEGGYSIRIVDGERVTGHKPSVNVLFRSVAQCAGKDALGIILTGMGDDGATGLLELRQTGAHTIGQDAATALVYGMPKVAFEIGAVAEQAPLLEVSKKMLNYAYHT